ncbi:30S ribosome-binding factor RbfA [Nakamurella aerolata]|uniref:Ribosome-binding factor A n=1 Tax=Nakamurella aerolata TaxID=1656892 RepID=A0A849A0S1_9ACTN|nr:30S ribosome-binding factor RbfA [Nakamurella aerolata]
MADSARARRLAKRIAAIVATELEHQVKDPRLAMLTVTGATLTPDLRDATVFYTVYGDDEEQAATAAALASATGVLRSAVGKQTGIKFTPTLAFKADTVPQTSAHIEDLLAAAKASDAEIARQAAAADYAGEADPYKPPREDAADTDDAAPDAAPDAETPDAEAPDAGPSDAEASESGAARR